MGWTPSIGGSDARLTKAGLQQHGVSAHDGGPPRSVVLVLADDEPPDAEPLFFAEFADDRLQVGRQRRFGGEVLRLVGHGVGLTVAFTSRNKQLNPVPFAS